MIDDFGQVSTGPSTLKLPSPSVIDTIKMCSTQPQLHVLELIKITYMGVKLAINITKYAHLIDLSRLTYIIGKLP